MTVFRHYIAAVLLALITALWCWVITSLHGAWSLGIVRGYLDGGMVPAYPSLPVTYAEFFLQGMMAFIFTFVPAIILCSFAPQRFVSTGLISCWLLGFWSGANLIVSIFQIDFGTTWGATEAFRELFFHWAVTPMALILGPLGVALMARILRPAPPSSI